MEIYCKYRIYTQLVQVEADDRWTDLVRRMPAVPWRRMAVGVAVVLVAVGGCVALRPDPRAAAIVLPRARPAPAPTTTTALGEEAEPAGSGGPAAFLVHAAGAVVRPGVYRFSAPVRVIDLLTAAGGPGAGADLSGVNLAAPLPDGARVYFPRTGEEPPAEIPVVDAPPVASPGSGSLDAGSPPAQPVDLNTATAGQLEELPGIGPVTAGAIVEHRERVGPFRSVEALQDVSGIGPAKLGRIRDLVTAAP